MTKTIVVYNKDNNERRVLVGKHARRVANDLLKNGFIQESPKPKKADEEVASEGVAETVTETVTELPDPPIEVDG